MALVVKNIIDFFYKIEEYKGTGESVIEQMCDVCKNSFVFFFCSSQTFSADHRLDYLPFTSVPSILIVIGSYLYFVLNFGKKFMKNRKPYNIDRLLLYYNFLQVVLNFSLFAYVSP